MKANLKDLKLELWLRLRDSGEIKWTTKDGRQITIKEMSIEHLINTINLIEKVNAINDQFEEIKCDYEAYDWESRDR